MKKRIALIVLGGCLLALGGCQIPRPNIPPTPCFTANPTSGTAPLEAVFDATCSRDEDGYIVEYRWEFGDGTQGFSNSPVMRKIYYQPGTYIPVLTVTDNRGASRSTTGPTITVIRNQPPVACFHVSWVDWNIIIVSPACSFDPDGQIIEYIWLIDGRQFVYTSPVSLRIVFSRAGIYTITLTVKDNYGATNSTSRTVSIVPPSPPPPSSLNPEAETPFEVWKE